MTIRTRFAPSPTGDLHLGGAWTALASWVLAHRAGGAYVLRVEDIDRARVVRASEERILADLQWLGLDWDEGPFRQSERSELYEQAIHKLSAAGLVYPCDCSRAEIARVASAPHEGEEIVYPGHCRNRDPCRPMRRPPALRARVPHEVIAFEDSIAGTVTQNLARGAGDFVLKRGDGSFAYHLAVVVDDIAMRITDVVRGADLLESTPRQIWLARSLGADSPRYSHVPLVIATDGTRLEKRTPGGMLQQVRQAGIGASRIVGELAHGLGLSPANAPTSAIEVARACACREIDWRRQPWPIPESLLTAT